MNIYYILYNSGAQLEGGVYRSHPITHTVVYLKYTKKRTYKEKKRKEYKRQFFGLVTIFFSKLDCAFYLFINDHSQCT